LDARVTIVTRVTDLQEPLDVTPAAVEAAFIKANPNLSTEGMAIECDKKRLPGVRICLSKELRFRAAPRSRGVVADASH
jgi:ribonuclease T2